MKINIIYILIGLVFICGCASKKNKILSVKQDIMINDSVKDKYDALNDYFDGELKDQSREIIIITKKLSVSMILNILKTNDVWAVDSLGMARKDATFYKEEDWEKLREENGNPSMEEIESHLLWKKECCWTPGDFRYKKIIFEDLEFDKIDFENKHFSRPVYYIYWFTEPVYYKNKEYVIFINEKSSLSGFSYPTRLIIMKKIKNKWMQVYEAEPSWRS